MGRERFEHYLKAFEDEPPVSIRLNPRVSSQFTVQSSQFRVHSSQFIVHSSQQVPWCEYGYYLDHRPNFTFDPLLHAGCYYVQEAASMFIHHIVKTLFGAVSPSIALDACAAPGGKSTLLRAVLPADCVLCSNEPVRNRASILLENVQKWGMGLELPSPSGMNRGWGLNHIVTCNYPRDYRKAGLVFDLILCDVPCSGEGMFRHDAATIGEWSRQNVERCSRLQREIVADLWPCLQPGGILIYSTCTFNTKENEENIRWMQDELQAEAVPVATLPEWHITGSLLQGFDAPVYRFIPGITRSEGLFVCVLRKGSDGRGVTITPKHFSKALQQLNVLAPLEPRASQPSPPSVDLPYSTAIAYLRREAIILPPDTPRGLVSVTFQGHHLGYVKNIGSRANNLYPKEWAIKSTHIPNEYVPPTR